MGTPLSPLVSCAGNSSAALEPENYEKTQHATLTLQLLLFLVLFLCFHLQQPKVVQNIKYKHAHIITIVQQ